MSEKELKMSAFDIFGQVAETIEDAQKKSANESIGRKIEMLRMNKEGRYSVRILPLAPVKDTENNWTLPRKGYEYPVRELLLKIVTGQDKNGKDKVSFVNVRHLKNVYPEVEGDLIDTFVQIACEKYANDEALCKTILSNSFSGGLKYDSKRYMYVLNMDKRDEGIKMFSLSYPQYLEVEERKLNLWNQELQSDPASLCPISSPADGYPIEITRKKEGGKTSYIFDIARRKAPLEESELNALLELPRLPETLYRYTNFHLEATLAYLKQYEEQKDIDVLSDPRIGEIVEKIKLMFPAGDESHFTFNSKDDEGELSGTPKVTIDDLWDTYNRISDAGISDASADGQNLRNAIVDYINDNDLDVAYSRRATNEDLLNLIEDALAAKSKDKSVPKSTPIQESENKEDESEPATPSATRFIERNDDTNEPAVRLDRRADRPQRRRR